MSIRVNGRERPWRQGITAGDVVRDESPDDAPVVVRVGCNTLTRKDFDSFEIPDEAEVFLIHMIAGG